MAADEELQDLLEDVDTLYEDLYADVGGGRQLLRTSIQEMEERLDRLAKRDKDMEASLNDLQRQNEALQQEKSVLVRNISCLFKTAQLEIARKDRNIKELREENERIKSAKSRTPASHEKSRSRSHSVGIQRHTDSNAPGREHHSDSGRFDGQLTKDELPPATGKARESGYISSEHRSSCQPGYVREFRVRFDEQRCNDAHNIFDEPIRQRKYSSADDRRALVSDREQCSVVRRCRSTEVEWKEAYGKQKFRDADEEVERSKSRKLT